MEFQALLNEFPAMDRMLFIYSTMLVRDTRKLLNINEIHSILLPSRPPRFIEPCDKEQETLDYLRDYLSGNLPYSPDLLDKAKEAVAKLQHQQQKNLREKQTDFFKHLCTAYILNCAHQHCGYIPFDFFNESTYNIRYRISGIHSLANRMREENPKSFDDFRRTYADIFAHFTYLNQDTCTLLFSCLKAWFSGVNNRSSWDRVVAAMMVTAHLVCTLIQFIGLSKKVRERTAEMIFALANFLNTDHTPDLLLEPNNWLNIRFLRELNATVIDLDIPGTHQAIDRDRACFQITCDVLDDENMQEALDEFIPLNSEKFMGVCPPPVTPLTTIAYNGIPLDPASRREYVHTNIYKYQQFDDIA